MEKKRKRFNIREYYSLHLQMGITGALLIGIIVFSTVKGLEVKPYKPKKQYEEIKLEEVTTEVQQMEELPPPPKPKVSVEVTVAEEGEEAEEVEIAPTTFEEFEEVPPPPTEQAFEIFQVEKPPQVIRKVEPQYPEVARKARIEGKVVVKALVDTTGRVIRVQIITSSNPIFEEAAKQAAMKFLFTPGEQQGRKVKVWVSIPFRFKLTK